MEQVITLDHGSGGKKTSALIDELILPLLQNDALCELGDGAVLTGAEKLVFSTDSFVVTPYFFPGGDIGKLSVCGTVNDVAMSGGEPKYLSLSLILEEGLPLEHLKQIIESIRVTAEKAGVHVVTGDTKVVEKGKGDGIFINTSGIGVLRTPGLSPKAIKPGDKVLVSGTVGDHGAAVMLARHSHLVEGELRSDCAALHELALALGRELGSDLRVLRDPTEAASLPPSASSWKVPTFPLNWKRRTFPYPRAWKAPATFWVWIRCTVPTRANCWQWLLPTKPRRLCGFSAASRKGKMPQSSVRFPKRIRAKW